MRSLWSFLTLGNFWLLVACLAGLAIAWTILRSAHSRLPSWFLPSLDSKDRRLLLWCGFAGLVLAVITGVLLPNGNSNDNPLPSTYLSGQHGAMAAYETLVRAGYPVERWERPLPELAATAGPETVIVFAQPFTREIDDIKAVQQILEKGGRVLATGFWGGYLLPGSSPSTPREFNFAACKLEPEGLDPLANSGEVWMVPEATWQLGKPSDRVEYSCAGQPAVVEYDWGDGHVVWWASATPLESGSITRAHGLDLLLNSLGPKEGHHFYWDESLHGELPQPVRATPIEFIDALGSLYRNADAASTVVSIALERFRRHALRLSGMQRQKMDAADLAALLRRRFPDMGPGLENELAECEAAAANEVLSPRDALRMVQILDQRQSELDSAARPGGAARPRAAAREREQSINQQERAS